MSFVFPSIMSGASISQCTELVLLVRTLVDQGGEPPNGESVTLRAEACDHAIGAARDIGVMAECLPLVDIRDMNLDHGTIKAVECIEDRNGAMGKGRRIDRDATCGFAGFVDPVDDFIFAVALMEP